MKKLLIVSALLFILAGCQNSTLENSNDQTTDESVIINETESTIEGFYIEQIELSNVNEEYSNAIATVSYNPETNYYVLTADVYAGLPELEDGYFYEGWIVRSDPLNVISTGPLTYNEKDQLWNNMFTAEENLSDHLQYIITLEPDDGDPAPALHMMEGSFTGESN